jgi:hypothetical protein
MRLVKLILTSIYLVSNIHQMEATTVDPRQERGKALARSKRIRQIVPQRFYVPSSTGKGGYLVDLETPSCSCEDWQLRGTGVRGDRTITKCKHMFAVYYATRQSSETDVDSEIFEAPKRVTYPQPWREYNLAQVEQKDRVRVLLRALCDGIKQPPPRPGRQPLPLSDVIYAAVMKTFVDMSGRRACTDLRDCQRLGFLRKVPSYNALFEYMAKPEMTQLLQVLVQESAAPLAEIDHERMFATDSSGFSTCVYKSWLDHRYSPEASGTIWIKLHMAMGVRSKIITAAVATEHWGKASSDHEQFKPLLSMTGQRFTIEEALADKGYFSLEAMEFVTTPGKLTPLGARCYIPFRADAQGDGPAIWRKAYHLFHFHRDLFLTAYSKRATAEAVFSSVKRQFGGSIRERGSKKEDHRHSMINAVLTRVIAYNLTILTKTIHTLKLEPTFWGTQPTPIEAAE